MERIMPMWILTAKNTETQDELPMGVYRNRAEAHEELKFFRWLDSEVNSTLYTYRVLLVTGWVDDSVEEK